MVFSPRSSSVPGRQVKRSRIEHNDRDVSSLDRLRALTEQQDFPDHMKLVVDCIMDLKEENRKANLRIKELLEENREANKRIQELLEEINKLRKESASCQPVASQDLSNLNSSPVTASVLPKRPEAVPSVESNTDPDLRRSIVVSHLPENREINSIDQLFWDLSSVTRILDFLGVACLPVSVYRMGRSSPRLLKVVLPTSRFQEQVLRRASRLRFSPFKGVFIRKSLTLEERIRLRNERSNRRNLPSRGDCCYLPESQMSIQNSPSSRLPESESSQAYSSVNR